MRALRAYVYTPCHQGDDGADDAADMGADGAGEGADDGAPATCTCTCTCSVAPGDEEAPTGGATSTGGGGGTVRAGTHGSLGGEGGAEDNELVVRPHDLQTLRAMSAAEISAIEDFEVSRPGCGSLRWSGRTDLRAVLPRLAEIVRFKPHQVRSRAANSPQNGQPQSLRRCSHLIFLGRPGSGL